MICGISSLFEISPVTFYPIENRVYPPPAERLPLLSHNGLLYRPSFRGLTESYFLDILFS